MAERSVTRCANEDFLGLGSREVMDECKKSLTQDDNFVLNSKRYSIKMSRHMIPCLQMQPRSKVFNYYIYIYIIYILHIIIISIHIIKSREQSENING
jgi:hypothetical protein